MKLSNEQLALQALENELLEQWGEAQASVQHEWASLMALGAKAAEAYEQISSDNDYGYWVKALCAKAEGLTDKIVKACKWCHEHPEQIEAIKEWKPSLEAPVSIYNAHGKWKMAMALAQQTASLHDVEMELSRQIGAKNVMMETQSMVMDAPQLAGTRRSLTLDGRILPQPLLLRRQRSPVLRQQH